MFLFHAARLVSLIEHWILHLATSSTNLDGAQTDI